MYTLLSPISESRGGANLCVSLGQFSVPMADIVNIVNDATCVSQYMHIRTLQPVKKVCILIKFKKFFKKYILKTIPFHYINELT